MPDKKKEKKKVVHTLPVGAIKKDKGQLGDTIDKIKKAKAKRHKAMEDL